jgi:hypothetical protein
VAREPEERLKPSHFFLRRRTVAFRGCLKGTIRQRGCLRPGRLPATCRTPTAPEFTLEQARRIAMEGEVPAARPATADDLLELFRHRHAC